MAVNQAVKEGGRGRVVVLFDCVSYPYFPALEATGIEPATFGLQSRNITRILLSVYIVLCCRLITCGAAVFSA